MWIWEVIRFMLIGSIISKKRTELHISREELAKAVGVSPQDISHWENNWSLPSIDKITRIADALQVGTGSLLNNGSQEYDWEIHDQMFSAEHMFIRLKTIAEIKGLRETYKALYYAREKHKDQLRKKPKFSDAKIPYISHPLMMACHAQSMGINEDAILAVILLHDVCEDCGVLPDELPFSEEIRTAVDLLTKQKPDNISKEEYTVEYYRGISSNRIASLVKIIDRCNNVSTMALSFSDQKLSAYIDETEKYVLPLISQMKRMYPDDNNVIFLVKYQILSVLESLKAMLMGR